MKHFFLLFGIGSFFFVAGCKDACKDVVCENGGTCIEGTCACPEQYTGVNCETEVTPNQIHIDKIVVKNFPITEADGASWDLANGPDIFIKIFRGSGTAGSLVWDSDVYYEDVANGSGSYEFTPGTSVSDVNSQFTIALYDYDTGAAAPDDLIGWVSNVLYFKGQGFPAVVNFTYQSLNFDVYLRYTW